MSSGGGPAFWRPKRCGSPAANNVQEVRSNLRANYVRSVFHLFSNSNGLQPASDGLLHAESGDAFGFGLGPPDDQIQVEIGYE